MTNVVELDSVSKHYGSIHALESITLSIPAGEIFGLLGPNGAGKTTLIRLLTGSTRPTSGSIKILGRDPKSARPALGYMPQSPALYEDLSPRDNLRFFGRAHPIQDLETRIDQLLDLSDLRARSRDPVYRFSGGMKQRVSLACALLHRPRLLLLDEPTAGVDLRLRADLWKYFRDLAAHEHTTLLISTHQMDEALFCDRLAVLSAGTLLACDTPKNLLDRGGVTIHIWRGGNSIRERVENRSADLAPLLHRYGLDPSITKLELEPDTLESIVLRFIEARNV